VSLSRRVPLEGEELERWREGKAAAAAEVKAEAAAAEMKVEEAAEAERVAAAERAAADGMDVDSGNAGDGGGDGGEGPAEGQDSLLGVAQVSGAGTRAADLRRRRCLIDGFEPPLGAAAPTFDEELWQPEMTDFGEAVDAEPFEWAMQAASKEARAADAPAGPAAAAAAAAAAASTAAAAAAAAAGDKKIPPPAAPPPPPEEAPSKTVVENRDVHLRAAVHVCDYEVGQFRLTPSNLSQPLKAPGTKRVKL
jgi:hypothetical protein